MAQIRKNDDQMKALNRIINDLEVVKTVNEFLAKNEGVYEIVYKKNAGDKGKIKKLTLDAESKEAKKVRRCLLDIKHSKVKDIDRDSKKYKIDLTGEEVASMLDDAADANSDEDQDEDNPPTQTEGDGPNAI